MADAVKLKDGFSHELHWRETTTRFAGKNWFQINMPGAWKSKSHGRRCRGDTTPPTLRAHHRRPPKKIRRNWALIIELKCKQAEQNNSHHGGRRPRQRSVFSLRGRNFSDYERYERTAHTQLRTYTVLIEYIVYLAVVKDHTLRSLRKGFTTQLRACVL